MEDWKEVPNFNGRYWVSDLGRVWSAKIGLMKTPLRNTGYPHLNFFKDGITHRISVHRIVGLCFIENPKNKPTINHKNGIRHDNRVENLEWATMKEQNIHSVKVLGRVGAKNNHRRKVVIAYKEGCMIVQEFNGIREAARVFGISYQAIQKGLKKNTRLNLGWNFELLNDPKWKPNQKNKNNESNS